jgi:pimeloyl-ACP methyl ester carboxylesterase
VKENQMHEAVVREIVLDGGGVPISGWLAVPTCAAARATVVAIHGGGIRAGYFRGGARIEQSLLEVGAALGWAVLALDRPGYGASSGMLPEGQSLADQTATVWAALRDFERRHPVGAGMFLLAHSYGGALALSLAADDAGDEVIGLDISGCGYAYAVDVDDLPAAGSHGSWWLNWGVLRCYPPHTFRLTAELTAPMPAREAAEARTWPARLPEIARRVRVPIRFTFAEHERWWRQDAEALENLTALFRAAPGVTVDRQLHVGHNISLGVGARSYHLRALAFLEECLVGIGTGSPSRQA